MTVVAQEDHLTAGAWAAYGSSDPSPKSKTNMVKPRNDDSISSKVIRTQTEQFLELFSRTLNFFAPQRCEDISAYYCFDRTRLF